MDSPFEILGVAADADEETVERAYRERVKEAHPDQGGSVREFRRVQEAYERVQAGEVGDEAGEELDGEADEAGETGVGRDAGAVDEETPGNRVEYLNYEVLAEYGWELSDDDLFEKAAAVGLDPADYGMLTVDPDESLLEAAEADGFTWPFACRGGACTNCAVAVYEGEMPTPAGHILPPEMVERGIRLSCIAAPVTDDARVVFNVKHLPGVEELLLPASRFEKSASTD